jgi:quinol monooxygenase YgiN
MNLKWFVLPVLALAVSVAPGSWAKSAQEQAPARSQDMGRIVIVGYKPKPGKAEALRSLASTHMQRLRAEGLVTAREAIIMEASDGTIIEVFEWKSKEAIESAHKNPGVQALWKEFSDVCDYVPVATIAEAKQLFAEFAPVR